ncbi:glycoside hydrolase family 16 protein [Flagellimonas myxillae]|uniref:glycoside hydrolase family 16 protein n=1 Tax=Flagellimonas myxillae TaxID=2942214 RepID=UPI00201E926E|nr:glycoside hydrolase family 16 protein [Muricauda myxillae]MCL6266314.1 glycoside hydrolase family 16 protein [Muricauda myxillae]
MKNSYKIKHTIAVQVPMLLILLLFAMTACETEETQTVTTLTKLVMSDEFDTEGAPNPSLWNYNIGRGPNGDGWGNQELQFYTDRTENVKVDNGFLLITAREESFEGASYTSARLTTQGLFEQAYGRFEARIRLPYGKGIWPAFWLLGNDCDQNIWPQCGEIDVMEYLGDSPTVVFGSVHGPGYSAGEAETKEYELTGDRFDTGFHVFGIEWSPEYINYYVDGDLYNQITPEDVAGEWVFDHPFYIILNVAVGGTFPGSPNDETTFPQTMLVDYVRVYENNLTD